MWWLIIPAVAIVGAWMYGAKHTSAGNPVPGFTSPGVPQIGDIATVALVSAEDCDSETSLASDPANHARLTNLLTDADKAVMAKLSPGVAQGLTAKFQLTAVNLPNLSASNPGIPTCIGVLVDPPVSVRLPTAFLSASIQVLTRNGVVVTK